MENEIIETVLTEVLEEQKHSNQLAQKNSQVLEEQGLILKQREETSNRKKEELKTCLLAKMEEIAMQVASNARPVKREFRILLFPEQGTMSYYKIVFGRILFWLVLLCIAKYAFVLGERWLDIQYENQKYKKAWENFYNHQNKSVKKTMQNYLVE